MDLFKKIINFLVSLFELDKLTSSLKEKKTITFIPQLGDFSENTRIIQEILNKDLSIDLKLDAHFGQKTFKAVQDYQKKYGLNGSGILGPKTIDFMGLEVKLEQGTLEYTRQVVYQIAKKELGQKEIVGDKHNPRIVEYHQTTGDYGDDEVAWCGSFVSWVLKQAGLEAMGSVGASARAWLNYGTETKEPQKGDIVVLWRVKKNGWQGHVGFYEKSDDMSIFILGGNQQSSVSIQMFPKSQLLQYRTYI